MPPDENTLDECLPFYSFDKNKAINCANGMFQSFEKTLSGIEVSFQNKVDTLREIRCELNNCRLKLRQETLCNAQLMKEKKTYEQVIAKITSLSKETQEKNQILNDSLVNKEEENANIRNKLEKKNQALIAKQTNIDELENRRKIAEHEFNKQKQEYEQSSKMEDMKHQLHISKLKREDKDKDEQYQQLQEQFTLQGLELQEMKTRCCQLEAKQKKINEDHKHQINALNIKYDQTLVHLVAEAGKVGNSQTELLKKKVKMLKQENKELITQIEEAQRNRITADMFQLKSHSKSSANRHAKRFRQVPLGTSRKKKISKSQSHWTKRNNESTISSIYDFYDP